MEGSPKYINSSKQMEVKEYEEKHFDLMGLRWKMVGDHISYLLNNHYGTVDRPQMAAVVDLDGNTSLFFLLHHVTLNEGTIKSDHPQVVQEEATKEKGPKMFENVKETLEQLKSYGLTIFVITARREKSRERTGEMLRNFGIYQLIEHMYMWGEDESNDVIVFKARQRQRIREQGYHIIAAFGDQVQDLTHGDEEAEEEGKVLNVLFENPF